MDAILSPTEATPTGKPDERRRDEWLLLALIGIGDIEAARYLWETHVPRTLRGLPSGEGWEWDDQRQLYLSRTGRAVGGQELKSIASGFSLSVENDLRADASNMAVGTVPIDQWQRAAADTVKDLNIAEAAVAVGGFAKLSPKMLERVQGVPEQPPGVAFSLDRLYSFAHDVAEKAERADTEAAIVQRAGLYANASQTTFEDAKRESHKDATDDQGRPVYLYERNILGILRTNAKPGHGVHRRLSCSDDTEMGWRADWDSSALPGLRTCMP